MNIPEKQKAIKASHWSAIITLLGVLIVISALTYSVIKSNSLETRVAQKELELSNLEKKKLQLNNEVAKLDTVIKDKRERTLELERTLQTLIDSLNVLKVSESNPKTKNEIAKLVSGASLILTAKDYYDKEKYDLALPLFQKAAVGGASAAMNYLSRMYAYGRGVQIDLQKSVYWYRRSAELGDPRATYWLGVIFESFELPELDPDSAKIWYERAVSLGDQDSQRRLQELKDKQPNLLVEFSENSRYQKTGLKVINTGNGIAIVKGLEIEFQQQNYDINDPKDFESFAKVMKMDSAPVIQKKLHALKEGDHPFVVFLQSGKNLNKSNGGSVLANAFVGQMMTVRYRNLGGKNFTFNQKIAEQSVEKSIVLRKIPVALSDEQVKAMLTEKGFYDSDLNQSGKGIIHNYVEQTLNGNKVVLDKSTGLMWQQSGSPNYRSYADVEKYIRDLNDRKFADHSDWRLPTLEELMSLMEPTKHDNLFIHPVFDETQYWIWSSDHKSNEQVWYVDFRFGDCYFSEIGDEFYVRAVR